MQGLRQSERIPADAAGGYRLGGPKQPESCGSIPGERQGSRHELPAGRSGQDGLTERDSEGAELGRAVTNCAEGREAGTAEELQPGWGLCCHRLRKRAGAEQHSGRKASRSRVCLQALGTNREAREAPEWRRQGGSRGCESRARGEGRLGERVKTRCRHGCCQNRVKPTLRSEW